MAAEAITGRLGSFATELTWDDVPQPTRERVVLHTLDQVGAALAGSTTAWVGLVRDYALAETPDGPCTILGSSRRGRPEWAALANATAGHGLEIDDWHVPALVHPGCVLVPTVLALAQADDEVGGHRVLTALALGFEAIVRLGLATTPSMTSDRGFHVTGVHGVMGATLSAAALRGLDAGTTASALGLAGSHAGGLTEYTISGGEVKRLHAGLAAMGALRSVNLAERGFHGPPTVVEGRKGYLQAFAEQRRPEVILDGLGEVWHADRLAVKPYCACAGIHAPLGALEQLRGQGLVAEDVAEIVVGFAEPSLHHVGEIGAYPHDMTGAQFSAQFSLAMNLVLGGNDLAHYQAFAASDHHLPEVSALAERVRLEVDAEADAAFPERIFATVTVRRRDGSTMTATSGSRGTPDDPLAPGEVVDKYRRLAATAVDQREVDRIEAAVFGLLDDGPAATILAPD